MLLNHKEVIMPFTLDGEWIPAKKEYPPLKIIKEKRKGSLITLIKNIPLEGDELKAFASELKKHLACGGSLKNGIIELQGDKAKEIQGFLKIKGLKYQ